MKRNVNFIVIAGIIAFAFSSCKKECYECERGSSFQQLCENDYSNRDEFKATVDLYESNGWKCK